MSRGTSSLFRIALLEAIETSGKSRDRIVCEINELTGRNLTKFMVDKYTCANHAYSLPSELLPTFCKVTGSDKPFRVLLGEIGLGLRTPTDLSKLKIIRLQQEVSRLDTKIQRLKTINGI